MARERPERCAGWRCRRGLDVADKVRAPTASLARIEHYVQPPQDFVGAQTGAQNTSWRAPSCTQHLNLMM